MCGEAWDAHGVVKGAETARCAALAYRFCAALAIADWSMCRVVLTCVRMLAECNFDVNDIEVTFAMALATMRSPRSQTVIAQMGPQEKMLVAILHVYCAHSLVFDEFVGFDIWHEWVLAPFCSMKSATMALKKVCALRGWRFSAPEDVLLPVLAELQGD